MNKKSFAKKSEMTSHTAERITNFAMLEKKSKTIFTMAVCNRQSSKS